MKKSILLLLILVTSISCGKSADNDAFKKAIDEQNSYRALSDKDKKVDFDRYFVNGEIDGIRFRLVKLGDIAVSSGRIVACDPFYVSEKFTCSFKKKFPMGSFGVYLSVADKKDWGERVAFAKIRFSEEKVVRYETAEFVQTTESSGNEYPVDAGLGCFMDYNASVAFSKDMTDFYNADKDGNFYSGRLEKFFKGGDWAVYPLKGHRIFIFSSGYGDGSYTSYIGYDAHGKVVCLITDFAIIGGGD